MDTGNSEGGAQVKRANGEHLAGSPMFASGPSNDDANQSAQAHAQSAISSAKDAVGSGVQAANIELEVLKDQIAKLGQTVSQLVQNQASSTRDQVAGAVGSASATISHSAAAAQERLTSVEHDVEARIQRNPWSAILIAGLVGLLIGKAV